MSIDYESRKTTFRFLFIFFIIATIIINLVLLIKYVRMPGFLNIPGICMKMAVAAGNIFMALFSYVILTKIYFDDTEDMTCRSQMISSIYMHAFLPFVFGCSVAVQCCYLYLGNSFQFTLNPKARSLAIAGIPWIFGIVIICPLTMIGIDWESNCSRYFTVSRERAIVVISMLLPACIALIFSIILSCKPSTQNTANILQNQAEAATIPLNPTVNKSYPTQPFGTGSPQEYKENQHTNQYPQQDPQQYSQQHPQTNPQQNPQQYPQENPQEYPQQHLQANPQHFPQPHSHTGPQLYPQQYDRQYAQQYPQQYQGYPQECPQQCPQQYPQPYLQHYPMQNPMSASGPVVPISSQLQRTNRSRVVSPQSIASEKRGLLLASLIFFVSVMPWACFNLGYILDSDRASDLSKDSFIIVKDVCLWLLFIYPTLVPLAWLGQIF